MLLDDQIQFLFHREQHIGPIVPLQTIRPYADQRWVRSFLLLPAASRLGQQPFYRHLLVV
jgi:hypothetical protein